MCIIMAVPQGATVPTDNLKEAWRANPDGGGYMYPGKGKLEIRKGFMDFDSFHKEYIADRIANPDLPFVVHFRIKTIGNIKKANCHPHRVNKNLGLAHNGTLRCVHIGKKDWRSDSKVFAEDYLAAMPRSWRDSLACRDLIEAAIGTNKIVTLDTDGDMRIFNEHEGHWDDGVWYSNDSYESFDFSSAWKSYDTSGSTSKPAIEVPDWAQWESQEKCQDCGYPMLLRELDRASIDGRNVCDDCIMDDGPEAEAELLSVYKSINYEL